jgi:hypothetical protein
MNAVSGTTSSTRRKPRLVAEATTTPGQPRRLGPSAAVTGPNRPSWLAIRLETALKNAEHPMRARSLAYDLGLSAAEVTAELRRLQDLGVAISHDRRWTAASAPGVARSDEAAAPRKSA